MKILADRQRWMEEGDADGGKIGKAGLYNNFYLQQSH
jgi:hypothetical protein